jgi:hypothetical protein
VALNLQFIRKLSSDKTKDWLMRKKERKISTRLTDVCEKII